MPKYHMTIVQRFYKPITVEAESEEQAKDRGIGKFLDDPITDPMDSDVEAWDVKEVEDEGNKEESALPNLDYELSDNQEIFVIDARSQGFTVDYNYSGRFMYGEKCPAIKVDGPGEFNTDAEVFQDQLGKRQVIYAKN